MASSFLIILYFIAFLLVSVWIAAKRKRQGPDHYFYAYYIALIRKNNHNYILTFPNFVNEPPVCDPQYLYRMLSYLPDEALEYVAVWLNPVVMTLTLVTVYIGLLLCGEEPQFIFWVILLLSIVPQYYYINNSRLYGLSGRGVGMLLFAIFGMLLINLQVHEHYRLLILSLGSVIVWIIIGSNIFAFQGVLLVSLALLCIDGSPWSLFMLLAGALIFVLINRKYAFYYYRHLVKYWLIYKNILAERFILAYRPSIYRDFIFDFYIKFRENKANLIAYAYGNSILILLFLSPVGVVLVLAAAYYDSFVSLAVHQFFALKLTFASLFAFFLTSLKYFRFWGEPERYVELTIPFTVYVVVACSFNVGKPEILPIICLYFICVNVMQWLYYAVPPLVKRRKGTVVDTAFFPLNDIISCIQETALNRTNVTAISNNLKWTTMLLNVDWHYIFYWPSVDNLDGYKFSECFDRYPQLNNVVMTDLAIKHRATHVLFDTSTGESELSKIIDNYYLIYSNGSVRLWCNIR